MNVSKIGAISVLALSLAAFTGCEQQDDMPAAGESSLEGQASDRQVGVEQEGVTVPGDVMEQPQGARDEPPAQEPLNQ
ncbi:hypothetical protein [Allohahella sp. A8]|uniref:hypothetical protein n=1 Tax=Allohahella sp. A8 TaxID=3141461 RepID=UPI000C0A8912|nr:hypothetical protein [Hahellaceae bacterium]|tara:strand:+ start:19315 stop:19548 length:234 start_codon:yes stop_codon:yes gene_type:complete